MEREQSHIPLKYDGEFGAYVSAIAGAYEMAYLDSVLMEGGDPAVVIGGIMPIQTTKSASTVEEDIRQMFGYQTAISRQKILPRKRKHARKHKSQKSPRERRANLRKSRRSERKGVGKGAGKGAGKGRRRGGGDDAVSLDDFEVARELDSVDDSDTPEDPEYSSDGESGSVSIADERIDFPESDSADDSVRNRYASLADSGDDSADDSEQAEDAAVDTDVSYFLDPDVAADDDVSVETQTVPNALVDSVGAIHDIRDPYDSQQSDSDTNITRELL
jgi:hypothetical protein